MEEFLKNIGVEGEEKDFYSDLKVACTFFEGVDLVELEPKKLQEGYGKLDSLEEEVELSSFVKSLKTKISRLRKSVEETIKQRH